MRGQVQFRALVLVILAGCSTVALRCTMHSIGIGRPVASGRFHSVSHYGSGEVTVYQRRDETYVLRLKNVRTSERPDLLLYAISRDDAFDNESVTKADRISLGALQITGGAQTYVLPTTFDPSRYHAVTVWSAKYQVNFTTAALKPLGALSRLNICSLRLGAAILTIPARMFRRSVHSADR